MSAGDAPTPAPRPDPHSIRRATSLVLAARSGQLDAARAALADPSPRVRSAALHALENAGALLDDQLTAAMTDVDVAVRRDAAQLASVHPGAPIIGLLDDDDSRVVEMACWAAGERVEGDAEAATTDRLCVIARDHSDALCREAAVAALGAIGRPDTADVVLAAMSDKATVRRRAVLALAAFNGPQIEAALETALTDRDWQVRQAAEDLL
ncbi:MAG: HEAT repeat domain-containing protein [Acidimicrobiales bacterium]|nr:HEAT repeat domain-containing protein [Acidimicrobiales bacterium]